VGYDLNKTTPASVSNACALFIRIIQRFAHSKQGRVYIKLHRISHLIRTLYTIFPLDVNTELRL